MRKRNYIPKNERELATVALTIHALGREGILDQYMIGNKITPAGLLKAWSEHCTDDESRQERVYTTSAVIQGNSYESVMWELFKTDFMDLTSVNT